jgi:flagellar biogenesis protein FliO
MKLILFLAIIAVLASVFIKFSTQRSKNSTPNQPVKPPQNPPESATPDHQ